MISLPNGVRNRPIFRIMTMPEGTWQTQEWTALPIPLILNRVDGGILSGTAVSGGYHLQSISRWCLPDEDRAQFYIDTGMINGAVVTAAAIENTAIRIQVLDDEQFPTGSTAMPTTGWKTVFVGTCIYSTSHRDPGNRSSGRTTYFCAGALWRTRDWPMDRHTAGAAQHAKGHPGYNYPLHGWFRKVLGNKGAAADIADDPFGDLTGTPDISSYYAKHALPLDGAGATATTWTDEDVIKHAVASSRAIGEARFAVDLSSGLFDGSYAWNISPGDSCWDLLRRVCNRQRGRGSVYLDYTDADSEGGDVILTIKARASHVDPIVYKVGGLGRSLDLTTAITIPAAEHGVDAVDVDIAGDHRVTDAGFQYDDRQSSVFDGITVQGECIQVLCNLNFFGGSSGDYSLDARWSTTDQTSFNTLTAVQMRERQSPRWRQVWRRFGPSPGYTFTVKALPSAASTSINYKTDADGTIITDATDHALTSTMTLRIMNDLPIYEGWKYSATSPERYDGNQDYLPPARMSPQVLYQADTNAGGDLTWLPLHYAGFNIQTDDFGLYITHPTEDASGVRFLADSSAQAWLRQGMDKANGTTGVNTLSGLDKNKLNTIVGVELGTRPSFFRNALTGATGDRYERAGRRMTMTVNGVHLWLGAPGAIYDYDLTRAGLGGYNPAVTLPASTTAYIIRDDRDALSFISALAWEYYGRAHNPGTWGLKDCGLMTAFATRDNGDVKYPTLGQLVGKVTFASDAAIETWMQLDTPITSIHYDHDAGETTWRTDYVSYDGSVQ